ncbi:MAG: murein hydrolase activator EnvC family protein [Solirubrobacteraceae bacterium]
MRLRLLLAGAVLPLALWAALPVFSEGASSPSSRLHELQDKIQTTRGKIGRRKGTERLLTTQISAYSQRIGRLQGRIGTLESQQSNAQADLDAKRAELFGIQRDLRAERRRLVRLRARLAQARVALAQRLVELYQADKPDIVTVIMSSKGFAELLERGEFMQRVSEQDQRIIKLVHDAKADATATAARLDKLEVRQQRITAIVQQRRDEIARAKQGLIDTKVGLDGTREDKARALGTVRAERRQLEGNLSGLKAEQSKIQATLQQAQGNLPAGPIKHGNGSLIWPVNGPITSQFCERRAWEACHPGIDIGVPSGTPIRAAGAGRVALMQSVGASGGYGNFTCIQHTGALSTCYAHQSRFATSLGASVSQGQVIGDVGCTGLCFGAHLHFEVRINGAVTNPLNYL